MNMWWMDSWQVWIAVLITVAYVWGCAWFYLRSRAMAGPSRGLAEGPAHGGAAALVAAPVNAVWVIYASQSGQAEAIARQTARLIGEAGRAVVLRRLDQPWLAEMPRAAQALFVVSTYGEGDAPEHAGRFAQREMAMASASLKGLKYAVLALGDRGYSDFCGFGRRLEAWLRLSGATALGARIDVDRGDEVALAAWFGQWAVPAGSLPEAAQVAVRALAPVADFAPWRLVSRTCLNPGSVGEPVCLVRLEPVTGAVPDWQAGDLVDIVLDGEDARPRSYSIANAGGQAGIELIVRRHVFEGRTGRVSGWLTGGGDLGAHLSMRVRANPGFRLAHDARAPLILLGAGVGLGGLRGHLQARAQFFAQSGEVPPVRCTWLLFGERSAGQDRLCGAEIEGWLNSGVLSRVDLAFSRDGSATPYVQDHLLGAAAELRSWVDQGAVLAICGSAGRMAIGVDAALWQILGEARVDAMLESGQLRRDVF